MKIVIPNKLKKLAKVAVYIGVSSILTYIVTAMQGDPELFGELTPIINLILVGVVDKLKESEG